VKFVVSDKGLISFYKEDLIGVVHPEAAHLIEGKYSHDKYQEQQKPSKAQDAFCQTGKKGIGTAEIFGNDSWIHGFSPVIVHRRAAEGAEVQFLRLPGRLLL
jgi:hypothetical protein